MNVGASEIQKGTLDFLEQELCSCEPPTREQALIITEPLLQPLDPSFHSIATDSYRVLLYAPCCARGMVPGSQDAS